MRWLTHFSGLMVYASPDIEDCPQLTQSFSYLMMQALAEMSVLYPINGAFTMYICRFVDPSFGFACGWEYAISWLTVLPFEISAACNIIHYWPGSNGVNNSAWIVPLLCALVAIQFFGVRGYGEASSSNVLWRMS